MPWRWIQREALVRLHDMCSVQFGGLSGLRDEGLLESAQRTTLLPMATKGLLFWRWVCLCA
jgi:hypothetical protein